MFTHIFDHKAYYWPGTVTGQWPAQTPTPLPGQGKVGGGAGGSDFTDKICWEPLWTL